MNAPEPTDAAIAALREPLRAGAAALGLALVLFALVPLAQEISGLAALAGVTALLAVMIATETRRYGPGRSTVRHEYVTVGPTAELLPDERDWR